MSRRGRGKVVGGLEVATTTTDPMISLILLPLPEPHLCGPVRRDRGREADRWGDFTGFFEPDVVRQHNMGEHALELVGCEEPARTTSHQKKKKEKKKSVLRTIPSLSN